MAFFPGKIDLIFVIKTKSANSTLADYFDVPMPNATFHRWPFPWQNWCDICHEDQQIWLYSPLKLALLSRLMTMNQYQMQLCFLLSGRPSFTSIIFLQGFCSCKRSISPKKCNRLRWGRVFPNFSNKVFTERWDLIYNSFPAEHTLLQIL